MAKAITEHISLGEAYYHVKKIYSISILYFDIGIGSDYLYYGQNTFTGVHTGDQLQINVKEKNAIVTRVPADIFPEYVLIRVNEFDQMAVTPLEEWIMIQNDVIDSAKLEGRMEGRMEGRKEGLEEGAEKERLSNARKMKNKGLDYATITDITGLTSEEIANL